MNVLRRFRRKDSSALVNQSLISNDDVNMVDSSHLTRLKGLSGDVNRLTLIPGYDFLLASCFCSDHVVFDTKTTFFCSNSFAADSVTGRCIIVNICGDIVACIDFARNEICTWHTTTNEMIAKLSIPNSKNTSVRERELFSNQCVKLSEVEFIAYVLRSTSRLLCTTQS